MRSLLSNVPLFFCLELIFFFFNNFFLFIFASTFFVLFCEYSFIAFSSRKRRAIRFRTDVRFVFADVEVMRTSTNLHIEFFAIYSTVSIKIVASSVFRVNIRFSWKIAAAFPPGSRVITEIAGNWTQHCVYREDKMGNALCLSSLSRITSARICLK